MKIKIIIIAAIVFLASFFLLSGSGNSGMTKLDISDNPYYQDNTLIAVIGGLPLYYDEFRYQAYLTLGAKGLKPETADWDYTDGLSDSVIKGAIDKSVRWRVIELTAEDAGINLKDSDVSLYAAAINGDWITKRVAAEIAHSSLMYNTLFTDTYGGGGEKLSNDDALAFGQLGGIIRLKAIYFSTSKPLITEKEIAAKREQAAIFASEIKAGTSSFDDIMSVYGESRGNTVPDCNGYQFASGGVGDDIYKAAAALGIGESSDVIEIKNDGFYILQRLELKPDDAVSGMNGTLRSLAASSLFNKTLDRQLEVKYKRAYYKINPKLMFLK